MHKRGTTKEEEKNKKNEEQNNNKKWKKRKGTGRTWKRRMGESDRAVSAGRCWLGGLIGEAENNLAKSPVMDGSRSLVLLVYESNS